MFTLWYERTGELEKLKERQFDRELGSKKSWRLRPSPEARLYGDGTGC